MCMHTYVCVSVRMPVYGGSWLVGMKCNWQIQSTVSINVIRSLHKYIVLCYVMLHVLARITHPPLS